jgi:hypothetical protein
MPLLVLVKYDVSFKVIFIYSQNITFLVTLKETFFYKIISLEKTHLIKKVSGSSIVTNLF